MKRTLIGIVMLAALLASSCKKGEEPSGGSWTFEGITYNATSSYADNGSFLTATSSSGNNAGTFGTLEAAFNGTSLPTSSGAYTVVNTYPTASNQVFIQLTTDGVGAKTYQSTGASGTLTVQVTVSGKRITVSGTGIEMQNVNTPSDSSALTFTL